MSASHGIRMKHWFTISLLPENNSPCCDLRLLLHCSCRLLWSHLPACSCSFCLQSAPGTSWYSHRRLTPVSSIPMSAWVALRRMCRISSLLWIKSTSSRQEQCLQDKLGSPLETCLGEGCLWAAGLAQRRDVQGEQGQQSWQIPAATKPLPGFQLSLKVYQFLREWFKFNLVFLGWASHSLCKLTLRNHCVISADVFKKKKKKIQTFRASQSSWQYSFMLLDGLARPNLYPVISLHTQLSLTLSANWGVAPELPLHGVGSDSFEPKQVSGAAWSVRMKPAKKEKSVKRAGRGIQAFRKISR